jgi:ectoine hydroxylase-related dioxygenase (phytanoyl-CoA dioxygenase family)
MSKLGPLIAPKDVQAVLSAIRTRGYCAVENVLSQAETTELSKALDEIIAQERDINPPRNGHVRTVHIAAKNPVFIPPVYNQFALDVVQEYLGVDCICSTWTANTVVGNGGEIYWHTDYPYWTMAEPYPLWPLCLHVMWCLNDFTRHNGATAGIPGSHLRPHLPKALGSTWPDEAEIVECSAGSVIFAEGAWWHTSTKNTTSDDRHVLLGAYIRPFCIPQEPLNLQLDGIRENNSTFRRLFGSDVYLPLAHQPY